MHNSATAGITSGPSQPVKALNNGQFDSVGPQGKLTRSQFESIVNNNGPDDPLFGELSEVGGMPKAPS